ncbi:hypothetical protein BDV95DRAFT_669933 [Massariosphaeria phaeospora]|uniref:Uncharacterized protein n=1 Tax=Massariosphaeria phaeospora TaxID=100035 RepID=A0A7C8M581_9PLEO|nr:hypothetical protein BDV95DRAFT_669933 [Massariosphaeria phaeospora]
MFDAPDPSCLHLHTRPSIPNPLDSTLHSYQQAVSSRTLCGAREMIRSQPDSEYVLRRAVGRHAEQSGIASEYVRQRHHGNERPHRGPACGRERDRGERGIRYTEGEAGDGAVGGEMRLHAHGVERFCGSGLGWVGVEPGLDCMDWTGVFWEGFVAGITPRWVL